MEPPSPRLLRPKVTVVNDSRRRVPGRLLKRAVEGVLAAHGRRESEVCLLVTTDERVRHLNRTFRGVDEPTDVLSFPSGLDGVNQMLGDIAIALPYAERQAAVRGVELNQELGYLAIHGTLHLVGLDDETPGDRARMIAEMNLAAVAVGLEPDEAWASILHDAHPELISEVMA